jgi:hypothetical protein
LADNVRASGAEADRRMEEATRRLIYLGIQNAHMERRARATERLRQAQFEEMERLRDRLRRYMADDERRVRNLAQEHASRCVRMRDRPSCFQEINVIEIARLQNALLHSVPLNEYNKLLAEYKKGLITDFVGVTDNDYVASQEVLVRLCVKVFIV